MSRFVEALQARQGQVRLGTLRQGRRGESWIVLVRFGEVRQGLVRQAR